MARGTAAIPVDERATEPATAALHKQPHHPRPNSGMIRDFPVFALLIPNGRYFSTDFVRIPNRFFSVFSVFFFVR